jgi:hypothetical protein
MGIVDKRRDGLAECGAVHPSWCGEVKLILPEFAAFSDRDPGDETLNIITGRATLAPLVITLRAGARDPSGTTAQVQMVNNT